MTRNCRHTAAARGFPGNPKNALSADAPFVGQDGGVICPPAFQVSCSRDDNLANSKECPDLMATL